MSDVMSGTNGESTRRLSRAARLLALALGALSPSVAFGTGLIHAVCMMGDAAAHGVATVHQHDHEEPADASHDGYGCTWLGPCSGLSTALRQTDEGPALQERLVPRPVFQPTSLAPASSPLAYLIPPANPPPRHG